jgi:signal transduction histidine kinase
LPIVLGDTLALHRVLDNLVGNALKFTPAGGHVDVRLAQHDNSVLLEVSDNGIGISGDQLTHIFERFYQVNGSATRRYGGVGLGLALVKGVVDLYQGRIEVDSHEGEGTTIRIWLLANA